MTIEQRLRQHVRAGQRELERLRRQPLAARAGLRQIERAGADRPVDHRRRTRAKSHAALRAIVDEFIEPDRRANARHRAHEIFDHAVCLGMIEVEARQFAVADDVDAGLFLGVNDDARGIDQRLFGRQRRQPIGKRIRADHGCLDTRLRSHPISPFGSLAWRGILTLVSNWLLIT